MQKNNGANRQGYGAIAQVLTQGRYLASLWGAIA